MKNRNLYQLYNEIQSYQGTAIGHLLKGRIKDFFKDNGARIQTLLDRIKKLQALYFVLDEKGDIQFHPQEEGKPKEPIMIEGKTKADADKAYQELMDQPTCIM